MCFIMLLKIYCDPSVFFHILYLIVPNMLGVPALSLRAKVKWNYGDEIWFERSTIGDNLLQNRFKEMCKEAGLVGNFTDHSIRATAVTACMNLV